MGCASSGFITNEEKAIQSMELELNFQKTHCHALDSVFHKYHSNGKINSEQWKHIGSLLGLRQKDSVLCPKVSEFYKHFKEKDHYDFTKALALGVLMSYGSPVSKAKLLFELFDRDCSKSLSFPEVYQMVSILIEISVKLIPLLVSDLAVPRLPASENMVRNYLDILEANLPYITQKLTITLVGGIGFEKVSQVSFVDQISSLEQGKLLTPKGIRNWVYKLTLKVPPNPYYCKD